MAEAVVALKLEALGDAATVAALKRVEGATRQFGKASTETAAGARKAGNAIVNLAASSLGASGPVGKLAEGVAVMGLGGPVVTAVAAGVTVIAGLYALLTKNSREAAEQQDRTVDRLKQQADDGLPRAERALRDYVAAQREFNEETEKSIRLHNLAADLSMFSAPLASLVDFFAGRSDKRVGEAATARTQADKNRTQADVDDLKDQAAALVETIRVRGVDNARKKEALDLAGFLRRSAQSSLLTQHQQNELLASAADLTDALTGKKKALQKAEADLTTEQQRAIASLKAEGKARLDAAEAQRTALPGFLQLAGPRATRDQAGRTLEATPDITNPEDVAGRVTALQDSATRQIGAFQPIPPAVLGQLEKNVDDTFDALGNKITARVDGLNGLINDSFSSGLASGILTGLTNAITGQGDPLLAALGGIFTTMGSALISAGAAMIHLLPALSNPFTSGPAMIAAGAIIAGLGIALSAAATGGGSTSGIGAGAGSSPVNQTFTVALPSGPATAPPARAAAPTPVTLNVTHYGGRDPGFGRFLVTEFNAALARGVS